MSYRIVFTGGGTAGHVMPNIPLIEALQSEGWAVDYVGETESVESKLMAEMSIPFHAVKSGKLRRYLSWKNLLSPFTLLLGIFQSFRLIRRLKPSVLFSKGGYVAFPVVVGAWLNRIPILAHESDFSPGLANRLSFPFVTQLCVTFAPENDTSKVKVTGTPIRASLLHGNREKGLALCGFDKEKPCLLVIGGSQGANCMNQCVRAVLERLLNKFQVIHLCGKGKMDPTLNQKMGYHQQEFAKAELGDLYAAASLVISRAGANSLYEILALKKPHVLIPLSLKVSRGDQIQNAAYFKKKSISVVVDEEDLTAESLMSAIEDAWERRDEVVQKIAALNIQPATNTIVQLIKEVAHA